MNYRQATAALLWFCCVASPASAQTRDDDDNASKPVTEITIRARRLDAARANVNACLGASTYSLSNDTVESRPGGETTTISQILLQTPDVAQTGSGTLRVRQSEGGLEYRINNVILPEGMTDLGESRASTDGGSDSGRLLRIPRKLVGHV